MAGHIPDQSPQQPDKPDKAPQDSLTRDDVKARLATWQLKQAMARASLDMTVDERLGMNLSEYEEAASMSLKDMAALLDLPMPELSERRIRSNLFIPPAIYGEPGDTHRDADGFYPDSKRFEPPTEQAV
jgi:hypothetical protein